MNENIVLILGALLAISECLALIPSMKSSGIIDFVINVLKSILQKK